jgi:DNA helicase-2/ATP-dependent DNA helicase PcrA
LCTKPHFNRTLLNILQPDLVWWQARNQNIIVGNEKKFLFTLNDRPVKGFIDRVEQTPEGGYVIVDFKTGSKPSSLMKNSIKEEIQMNLYCLAIRELYGKLPVRASLYYVKDDKMVDYYPVEETIETFTETAKEIITAVCAEQFRPTPSFQNCKYCDYADLCERKETGKLDLLPL